MDRIVALSAVLVGLLSLLGTVLVSTHNGIETQRLANEIVQLRLAMGLQNGQRPAADATSPPSSAASSSSEERVAALTSSETVPSLPPVPSAAASETVATPGEGPTLPDTSADPQVGAMEPVAPLVPLQPAASSAAPTVASGPPAEDCIPVGTRFMATKGDSFPICNQQSVVKVSAVSQSIVSVDGVGTLPAGGLAKIADGKCTLNFLSADTTGYAEFKVTCP